MSTAPDVIVIGAGLHGCSAALHLARRGCKVVVIEKNTAGRHASGVNAGGVRRQGRDPAEITVRHTLRLGGREHTLRVTGQKPPVHPSEGSVEHFFKEHQWGFGRTRGGRLIRYEVAHPAWDIHPVRSVDLDWDWARVYGPRWAFLENAPLYSSVLAVGSGVRVYPKRILGAEPEAG